MSRGLESPTSLASIGGFHREYGVPDEVHCPPGAASDFTLIKAMPQPLLSSPGAMNRLPRVFALLRSKAGLPICRGFGLHEAPIPMGSAVGLRTPSPRASWHQPPGGARRIEAANAHCQIRLSECIVTCVTCVTYVIETVTILAGLWT